MQWNNEERPPLSKQEKVEAVLMGVIVALLYLLALGIFIDGRYLL
jgi:hypothetical protein